MTDTSLPLRNPRRRFGAAVLFLLAMGVLYLRAIYEAMAGGYDAPGPLFALTARAILVLALGYLLLSVVVEIAVYIESNDQDGDGGEERPEPASDD